MILKRVITIYNISKYNCFFYDYTLHNTYNIILFAIAIFVSLNANINIKNNEVKRGNK